MKRRIALFILLFSFCESRIVYIHIPKTGGTTIEYLLRQNFAPNQIYPYLSCNEITPKTSEKLTKLSKQFPSISHEVVFGHFPLWFFRIKDPTYQKSFTFTSLRDPIERVLSEDRFYLKQKRRKYSNPLNILSNSLCRYLSDNPFYQGEQLYNCAIETLKNLDFVIFMDSFEEDVRKLFSILDLKIDEPFPWLNTTEKESIDPEILEKIKEQNALDIRLYEFAKEYFGKMEASL